MSTPTVEEGTKLLNDFKESMHECKLHDEDLQGIEATPEAVASSLYNMADLLADPGRRQPRIKCAGQPY